MIKICNIPVDKSQCEDKRITHCIDCPYHEQCDFYWVADLWSKENKQFGKDSLLGPFNPAFVKPDFRVNHVITIDNGHDNFCCFNNPKTKDYVVIGDIYVDESARGKGISKQIIDYLMATYDKDIFAKCVRGTSAEQFWSHIGIQIDANEGKGPDFYEHREGKRDLGWYIVENKNKKQLKEELW